jgi:hypothetical protein
MATHPVSSRMVSAASVRDWLLWLGEHFDRELDTPENREIRRLGRILEELGRKAGAIEPNVAVHGTADDDTLAVGACLLASFDWEHGAVEFSQPLLLTNRLGSPDPEALITRLVAVTGIPERAPHVPPEPEYVL